MLRIEDSDDTKEASIEVKTKITVAPEEAVEIRRLELKNNGNNIETLEVTGCFEPVLSTDKQDYAHPAFNNLFRLPFITICLIIAIRVIIETTIIT